MSRTSLGQRNQLLKKQESLNLKQVSSGVRMPQEQLWQPTLNLQTEIQQFLFMSDKVAKAQAQFNAEVPLGETLMSVKDDFGVCVFKNGDRYIGSWKDRLMDGLGLYIFKDDNDTLGRTIYLGEFQKGRFNGIGKLGYFQEAQGTTIYYGTWIQGKKQLRGRYYYENPHTSYLGFWANDMKHGEGRLIFPGGEFTGNWVNDQRQGFGKLKKVENGLTVIYEGSWEKDGLSSGKVTYYDSNSSEVGKYEGQLLQGKKHGKGTYFWRGTIYEGEFVDDCIKGQGLIKIGKTTFKGYFKSESSILNNPQMKAILTHQNGDTFEGLVSIKDGFVQRNVGSYKYALGDAAEGEFQDNSRGELLGRFLYRWKNGQQRQFS